MAQEYLYCPQCGAEYYGWATTCIDCWVPLTSEPPAPVAEPPRRQGGGEAPGSIDVSGLDDDERALVSLLLRGRDIPHEIDDDVLRFAGSRADEVDELLGWMQEREATVDGSLTEAPVEARRDGPELASRSRRVAASTIDGFVFSVGAVGIHFMGGPTIVVVLARLVYEIVLTSTCGRTLGKLMVGTRVVAESSRRPPGWGASTVRALVLGVAALGALLRFALGSTLVVNLAQLALSLAGLGVVLPILWDPRRQGLHDRAAGTIVIDLRLGAATRPFGRRSIPG